MIGLESLPPAVQAGSLIGIVLLEAMVLYVGYGLAERIVGQRVVEQIESA